MDSSLLLHNIEAQILPVYAISTPSTESAAVLAAKKLRVLGERAVRKAQIAASTGSMSSTEARVQAVPAVQTSEILEALRVSTVFNQKFYEYCPYSNLLPALEVFY